MNNHHAVIAVLAVLAVLAVHPETATAQVVVVPRAGVVVAGGGEGAVECSDGGELRGACENVEGDEDLDDESGVGFGVDILFHTSDRMRLGFGAFWVTEPAIDGATIQGFEIEKLGSDGTLNGIFEYSLSKPKGGVDIYMRGEGGVALLLPGDDLEDLTDALESTCSDAPSGVDCSVDSGPYLGWNAGGGVGASFPLSPGLRLRADLTYRYTAWDLASFETSAGSTSIRTQMSYAGSRTWLAAGLEF